MLRSSRLRLPAVVLVALLINAFWSASATGAADDSNIPGIPLPGPVVTGLLGGPVYDHVYSMDVPADRVILIALSGDAGTDFDLYLFDSGATTVYSTQGQVASSTGPGSTESITYPARGGGRYYIDLNGASNVEGRFRLTVSIASDTTPPHVTLRLNDGAPATSDATIRVAVVATDDLSGVDSVQFSLDGMAWDSWRPYTPFTLWSFPQVDGERQLRARVRDRAGNVSAVAMASIVIDTVRPTVASVHPGPGDAATSLRPKVEVRFSEQIEPSTWTRLGFVLQRPDGSAVEGTYAYDAATWTGSFVPARDLQAGVQYVATIGAVTDLAGNLVAPTGTWALRPLSAHSLTLTPTARKVGFGDQIVLRGHINQPFSGTVTIERASGAEGWKVVGARVPDGNGDFAVQLVAIATARYRASSDATAADSPAVSAASSVTVGRMVTLVGTSSAALHRAAFGAAVPLRGKLGPAAPDGRVTMAVYRYDAARGAYVLTASTHAMSARGISTFAWRPSSRGRYYLRFTAPGTPTLSTGTSPAYRWIIA
jgi:hypothetical protein